MLDFVHQYLPILIVGAIIGAFTVVFVLAYLALQKHKEKEAWTGDQTALSTALAGKFFTTEPPGKPMPTFTCS